LARIVYSRRKAVFWAQITSITASNIEKALFPFAPKLCSMLAESTGSSATAA
jgi:hypothetical protein